MEFLTHNIHSRLWALHLTLIHTFPLSLSLLYSTLLTYPSTRIYTQMPSHTNIHIYNNQQSSRTNQLHMHFVVQQKIFSFQISVTHANRMQVVHRMGQLEDESLGVVLTQMFVCDDEFEYLEDRERERENDG